MPRTHTFLTLDALRGLAAIAVMDFHIGGFTGLDLFPRGYLAVDFFLMLSGFVLSLAYRERLDEGWSTASFLKVRLIRLYPLYLLGLAAGMAFSLMQVHSHHSQLSNVSLVLLGFLGLLMVPAPAAFQPGPPLAFPLNGPSWTLFFEILVNLLHAVFFRRKSAKFLIGVALVTGSIFAFSVVHKGTADFGIYSEEAGIALIRIVFSYTMGMLLYLAWKKADRVKRVPPAIPIVLLLGALAVPQTHGNTAVTDLALIVFALPLILLLGAYATVPRYLEKLFAALGTCSYALYILNVSCAAVFNQAWVKLRGHSMYADAPWSAILEILCTIGLALFVDAVYDNPVRKFLRHRFLEKARGNGKPIAPA